MEVKDRLSYVLESGNYKKWWLDITDIAKNFFGDVVTKVEISAFHSDEEEKVINEATAVLKDVKRHIDDDLGITCSNLDDIKITFINGKEIKFWISEWGGIRDCIDDI